jgi:hypothetical protein
LPRVLRATKYRQKIENFIIDNYKIFTSESY